MGEAVAAVAVCQHVFLKEIQLPSWESWAQGKDRHGSMDGLFVGWEAQESQHEMSGYPSHPSGW